MLEKSLILFLLNTAFYLKTLNYKYASDDIPAFHRPKEKNKWLQWFFVLEGRARSNPPFDHALTSLIHALVCIGIYLGFGANDISFLGAVLFSVNPANNQASVWISGRSYALPALGITWAMALPMLGPVFILCASYYNAGFLSPLMLLGSDHSWMVFFMPLIWLFHWRRFKWNVGDKLKMEMYDEDRAIKPQKLILFTKTFGFYTTLALIPFKNTFYHSFLQSAAGCQSEKAYTMNDRYFLLGVLYFLGGGYYLATQPWTMVSFGLVWWAFCIAPFCNLFRIHQEIAERYMYLPNVGLMIVLASLLTHFPIAQAVIITMYAVKMWFWMDAYQDDYYLLEYSSINSPGSWFNWHVKAVKRWDTKSYMEAIILWTMAKMCSPREFKVLFNLATALVLCNKKEEGLEYLKLAEANIPKGQERDVQKLVEEFRKGQVTILL